MIRRAPRPTSNFTVLSNDVIRDERLSWEARGILHLLLSMPDNWTAQPTWIADQGPSGIHLVRRCLKELEAHGYLTREKVRGENGRFRWDQIIHETPKPQVAPCGTSPRMVEPDVVEPDVVDREVIKTELEEPPNKKGSSDDDPSSRTEEPNIARDITTRYWDWSKNLTGHDPPEKFPAIMKIVEAALQAGFIEQQITRGLAAIEKQRPRRPAITKQTLWGAIDALGAPPAGHGTNDDWIEGMTEKTRAYHEGAES